MNYVQFPLFWVVVLNKKLLSFRRRQGALHAAYKRWLKHNGLTGFYDALEKGIELPKLKCPSCGGRNTIIYEDGVYGFECGNPECFHPFWVRFECKECDYTDVLEDLKPP